MNPVTRSVLSVALTAGVMYLLDPVSGRRRRVLLRDRCATTARRLDLGTRDARHDLSHRAEGLALKAKAHFGRPEISDKAVSKNVRNAIGRAVSHPEAVSCTVHQGNVYLRGDVFTYEHQHVLDEIRAVDGIVIVTDHLTPREPAEGVRPPQQGKGGDRWSVAGRVLVGATGCALLVLGIKERKALGAWGASAGQALSRISQKELEGKLEHIENAFEAGVDRAEAIARDAIDIGSEIADDVHARARQEGFASAGARH